MIGADDFGTFFDPDEFGTTVTLIEPGKPARSVNGRLGAPEQSGRLYRSGVDPSASSLRVRTDQVKLQLPRGEVPDNWKLTKVVTVEGEHSIAIVEPLGQLRALLTLVPYGDRAAQPAERGKWQASN